MAKGSVPASQQADGAMWLETTRECPTACELSVGGERYSIFRGRTVRTINEKDEEAASWDGPGALDRAKLASGCCLNSPDPATWRHEQTWQRIFLSLLTTVPRSVQSSEVACAHTVC